jgi:hypothetical protein
MSDLHKLETKTPTSPENPTPPYQDPVNVNELVEKVKDCETHDEIIKLINDTFPGWILGWPARYSVDYPHFQNNWEFVCKKSDNKTLSVIIVDHIVFNDPKFSLIKLFCELLTLFGHSVRRKEEFIGCKICGDAIPTQSVYNQLHERKINVPNCWMVKCQKC